MGRVTIRIKIRNIYFSSYYIFLKIQFYMSCAKYTLFLITLMAVIYLAAAGKGKKALLHFRNTPPPPPFCYWWLIMKKRGLTLYRSPNPNARGYESAIALETHLCLSAVLSRGWALFCLEFPGWIRKKKVPGGIRKKYILNPPCLDFLWSSPSRLTPLEFFIFLLYPWKFQITKLNSWIFHKIVLDPLEISRPKTKAPGSSTSPLVWIFSGIALLGSLP